MKKRNRYTKEMIDFLRNYDGTYKEKAEAFAKKFEIQLNDSIMDHLADRYGFRHGIRHTEYQKECARERLKLNAIARHIPMYSAYGWITPNGQRIIKCPKGNIRGGMSENRFVYEHQTGDKLTASDTVLHLDGDKQNNTIENLVKLPRGVANGVLRRGWVSDNPELTKLGVLTEKLILKIRELENR